MTEIHRDGVIDVLNRILESELAGVVRYTHYSFLVFGFGRIPIVSWLRAQATESLQHAQLAGEWITSLGAYPSLGIGPLLDSHKHDVGFDAARVTGRGTPSTGAVPRVVSSRDRSVGRA